MTPVSSPRVRLLLLGCASAVTYAAIARLGQSLHEEGSGGHSLLTILGLFAVCFFCYLPAIRAAARATQDAKLLAVLFCGAVVFRGLLLFSDPIEEIDLYRYVWDGAVSTSGVNPFRYSPEQVLEAPSDAELPADLARLVVLRDESPVLSTILARIHFGQLVTIYPPVSQVVFALATWTMPRSASLVTRLTIMKSWFVLFDLATLALVIRLLRLCRLPIGLCVIYAWCPLVIKEIANSGHLDSLAVFLTTLSLSLWLPAFGLSSTPAEGVADLAQRTRLAWLAAGVLALAVGAKLYPLVFAPLVFASCARRLGWRRTICPAAVFISLSASVLWPMVPRGRLSALTDVDVVVTPDETLPPLPPIEADTSPRDPSESLRAFLSRWEMNDFLFLLAMENLRPTRGLPPREVAWFSLVPEDWREAVLGRVSARFEVERAQAAFFASRVVTLAVYLILAGWLAWRAARAATASAWLQAAFLTVAWFWLLLPTGNPWYWTWAMPLVAFARGRAWLALSGLAMLYYLRFWLVYHFPDTPLLSTPYPGPWFFDYVVTWLEFGPWLIWLAAGNRSARAMLDWQSRARP